MRVALGTSDTKFSAALGPERCVSVTGEVKAGAPYLTQIGSFDVELAMEGIILLARLPSPHQKRGLARLHVPGICCGPACCY